ncbi:MAG: putative toxin-antitoxin system toxin component, PIN family [Elusimicrobia bacterium]|nr:putative toxin-antitoxin system toxin component, PIN family [Elusimicrobiota bacterium]
MIDANVVLSGVFWRGIPHLILRRWLQNELTLLVSAPILAEYRDVLQRFAGDEGFHVYAKWNRLLTEFSEVIEPQPMKGICRDPKDDIYLEAAVGGKAKLLISGDKDLLVLKEIYGIPILKPREFLNYRS